MSGWSRGRRAAVWLPGSAGLARWRAASWARSVLADPATVVLDCETTGLVRAGAPLPRVVELAVRDVAGRVVIDTRIDPGVPIPAAAVAVHGIGAAEVAGAPRLEAALGELAAALANRRVVIFNERFDLAVLGGELGRCGGAAIGDEHQAVLEARRWLAGIGARSECAMVAAARWRAVPGGRSGWRLPRLGGDPATAHAAAADCAALLELLAAMATGEHGTDLGAVAAHSRQPAAAATRPALTGPDPSAGRSRGQLVDELPQLPSEKVNP